MLHHELNYDVLRTRKHQPYIHGNGFIQLWLDDEGKQRLHVFPDEALETQKVKTPIHNHIFGFESHVFCGEIHNFVYSVRHNSLGSHQIYESVPQTGKDTKLLPIDDGRVFVSVKYDQKIVRPEIYDMPPFEYHETYWEELSATIMTKTIIIPNYRARVLCEKTKEPDNEFSRHSFDSEVLWGWIEKALNKK